MLALLQDHATSARMLVFATAPQLVVAGCLYVVSARKAFSPLTPSHFQSGRRRISASVGY